MNESSEDDVFSEGDSDENNTEDVDMIKIKMQDVEPSNIDVERSLTLEELKVENSDDENNIAVNHRMRDSIEDDHTDAKKIQEAACQTERSDKNRDLKLEDIMNESSEDDVFSEGDSDEYNTEDVDMTKIKMEDIDIEPNNIDVERNLTLEELNFENSDDEKNIAEIHKIRDSVEDHTYAKKTQEVACQTDSIDNNSFREEKEMKLPQHEEMQSNDIVEQEFKSVNVNPEKKLSCPKCSYTAKYEAMLISHMKLHIDTLEMTRFCCNLCHFETKQEGALKMHIMKHRREGEMFKCKFCEFNCKRKRDIKAHILLHNIPAEGVYKCAECNYLTKQQQCLKMHEILHKDISETFNCNVCDFQSRWKQSLNRHMLQHNSSEVYKCTKCDYSTKILQDIKQHKKMHKDNSEVCIFKCNDCNFQSRWKQNLNRHMWLQHNLSDVVYKCEKCNYSTKILQDMKKQEGIHKDESEVCIFKCNDCNFQSRWKTSLIRHMLQHNPLEVEYNCKKCDYSTEILLDMKQHKKIHKDKSEVCIFKCNDCNFQSRWKQNLNRHIWLQHNPLEVLNKCEKCNYSTKILQDMKKHERIHKVQSEVCIFKCNDCSFQSRWKESLKCHVFTHIKKKV